MQQTTDSNRYSCVAIALHWIIALLIIAVFAAGYWMTDAVKEEATKELAYKTYDLHKATGIIILALSLFRLHWRLNHTAPAAPAGSSLWETRIRNITHILFYVFIIAVPLFGWIMSSASGKYPISMFGLFEWPFIPLAHLSNAFEIKELFKEMHELFAFAMMALVGVHIAAAIYHHKIKKDDVLKRMLPECKPCCKK